MKTIKKFLKREEEEGESDLETEKIWNTEKEKRSRSKRSGI